MSTGLAPLLFGAVFLIVFGMWFFTFRVTQNQRIGLLDWFLLSLVGYGGGTMLFYIFQLSGIANISPNPVIQSIRSSAWIYPVYCCLVVLGLWFATLVSKRDVQQAKEAAPVSNPVIGIHFLAWSMFFIGTIAYWRYAQSYGGFDNLLKYSAGIRAGLLASDFNPYAFLKRFGGFTFFSTLLFFGLIFIKSKLRLLALIGFVASFCYSLFVHYSWEGRLALISFVLVPPFAFILIKWGFGTKTLKRAILLAIIPLIALPSASAIWGKSESSRGIASFFVKELSFPIVSLSKASEKGTMRYMKDIVQAPFYVFPTRIWKGYFGFDKVSEVNTENVMGVKKGERGSTVAVPVDFVTFSYMQGHIFGLVLVGFIFGLLLIKLDAFVSRNFPNKVREAVFAYLVIFLAGMTVLYGDPHHIIIRNFHFVIGASLIYFLIKKPILITDTSGTEKPAEDATRNQTETSQRKSKLFNFTT